MLKVKETQTIFYIKKLSIKAYRCALEVMKYRRSAKREVRKSAQFSVTNLWKQKPSQNLKDVNK